MKTQLQQPLDPIFLTPEEMAWYRIALAQRENDPPKIEDLAFVALVNDVAHEQEKQRLVAG